MNTISQKIINFQNTRMLASAVYEATGIIDTTAKLIKFVALGIFAIISDLVDLAKRAMVKKVPTREVEVLTFQQKLSQAANSAVAKVKQTAKSAQNFVKNNPKVTVSTIAVSALLIGAAYAYSPLSNLNITTPKKPSSGNIENSLKETLSNLKNFIPKKLLNGDIKGFLKDDILSNTSVIGTVSILAITSAVFLYSKKKRSTLESVAEKLASPEYPNLDLIADLADGLKNLDDKTKNWVKKHAKCNLDARGYKLLLEKEPPVVFKDINMFYQMDFEGNQLGESDYGLIEEIVKIIKEDNNLGSSKLLDILNGALADRDKYNNWFYIWHEVALKGEANNLKRIESLTKVETEDKDFELLEKVEQSIKADPSCLGDKRDTAIRCLETILNKNENTRFNYLHIIHKYLEDNKIYEDIKSLAKNLR